jgi:hypothetical protein
MDLSPTVGQLTATALSKDRLASDKVSNWGWLCAQYEKLQQNYKATLEGKETFNTEEYEDVLDSLRLWRDWFAHNALLLEIIMQDPKYGTPAALEGDYPMPDISIPIVKEVRK